jgi:hypothetical protein
MAAQVAELLAMVDSVAAGARSNDQRVVETVAATDRVKEVGDELRRTATIMQEIVERFHLDGSSKTQSAEHCKAA